jgi:hypothetical protein
MSHTTAEVLGPLVANPYPPSWPSSAFVIAVPLVRDIAWGGPGVVAGTVKVVGSPNSPVRRRVRLLRDKDGVCVGETWSDPESGEYMFSGLEAAERYTAISYDHEGRYRAVAADNLTAEVA